MAISTKPPNLGLACLNGSWAIVALLAPLAGVSNAVPGLSGGSAALDLTQLDSAQSPSRGFLVCVVDSRPDLERSRLGRSFYLHLLSQVEASPDCSVKGY